VGFRILEEGFREGNLGGIMDKEEKIARKIKNMKRYIDFLKSYDSLSLERLEEDYELRSAIERNFHLAIESALDIGEILISAEGFEKPEDYRSVIRILGDSSVIPKSFAEKFADAASFRNILVHVYDEVDTEKLHHYLQNNLKDFDEFTRYIAEYLKKRD
jgi:uncharacterized protein YutE (UPF0331/DUF86 family)